MSMNRKPDLRTLMPHSNKCSNMPTIVSGFTPTMSPFLLVSVQKETDVNLCFNAALQCEDFDLMLVSSSHVIYAKQMQNRSEELRDYG